MKDYRKGQSRKGNPERRALEYAVIMDQIERRRAAFMERLSARVERRGDCMCYRGSLDHKGYAWITFKYQGRTVAIHAHRVFLLIKTRKPIPLEYEAGHTAECKHRTCVKHVELEHYKSNAVSARAAA